LLLLMALPLAACRAALPPAPSALQPDYWPAAEWRQTAPEEQGIDSARLADALLTMREQGVNIHSLLVIRHGSVLVDAYFYPYDGETVHDLASVSKSIMTTLIGIAAGQGKLSLDDPMLAFFPDRTVANRDAAKEAITVRHLVSMSSGLDCTAEGDERTLQEMRVTDDWVQFALDRPVRWEPGTHFVYCSPAIHLLSPILEQATGMPALDFARQYLFEPLGIQDVLWLTDPQGFNRGSEGVYLHPHDMAKLGYLWLHGGVWQGKQIVPRQWVEDAVQEHMPTGGDTAYGYGWWVETDSDGYSANGRGGQHIALSPTPGFIVVTTGGGFELSDIDPLLLPAIGDLEHPLRANPKGVAELAAAVAAVAAPPAAEPPLPPPAAAQAVSGQTYVFPANPLMIESMALDFGGADTADTAAMRVVLSDSGSHIWPIGLDGVYRMIEGEQGLPLGLRGHWEDDETFLAEYNSIANNDYIFLRLHFSGDKLVIDAHETAHEGGSHVEGELQE
jgi:CubicO group peptidase (beta-lactamase class C family)